MDSKDRLLEILSNPVEGKISLDLDMVEYHQRAQGLDGYMSSGQLKAYDHNPRKFYIDKHIPNVDKVAYRLGRAFHTLVLEPEKFDDQYKNGALGPVHDKGKYEGQRYGQTSQKYLDWVDDMARVGKTVLPEKEFKDCIEMANQVDQTSHISHFFKGGLSEVTFEVELDGVMIQVRPDYIKLSHDENGDEVLVVPDLKKTRDIEWFHHDAKKFGYIKQLGIYRNIISLLTGFPINRIQSVLIAMEAGPYYLGGEFKPSESYLNECANEMEAAFNRYKKSLVNDDWPTTYELPTIIGDD